jgi:signal peptidase I
MSKQKSKFREYVEAIILAIVIALFIRTFVIQAYKIPSGSMKPTLLIGDHILVSKFNYGIKLPFLRTTLIPVGAPQRGDIVVFIYPEDRSKDFIKRVIGVPGDTIEIRNKKILLNGLPYNDKHGVYVDNLIIPGAVQPRDNFGPVTVPEGSLFVMGDNRDESYDSRFWGFVSKKDVLGKALIIYWSWNREEHWIRWSRIGGILH